MSDMWELDLGTMNWAWRSGSPSVSNYPPVPGQGPMARYEHAMVMDPSTEAIYIFGGFSGSKSYLCRVGGGRASHPQLRSERSERHVAMGHGNSRVDAA